tara:strand:- start:7581 stop:7940 length:360 start_codon:yes stop_codon:yes gene_type:complete
MTTKNYTISKSPYHTAWYLHNTNGPHFSKVFYNLEQIETICDALNQGCEETYFQVYQEKLVTFVQNSTLEERFGGRVEFIGGSVGVRWEVSGRWEECHNQATARELAKGTSYRATKLSR